MKKSKKEKHNDIGFIIKCSAAAPGFKTTGNFQKGFFLSIPDGTQQPLKDILTHHSFIYVLLPLMIFRACEHYGITTRKEGKYYVSQYKNKRGFRPLLNADDSRYQALKYVMNLKKK